MRYGIYGAGSLGIVLGAYLGRAGIPVDLINHNPEQVRALNAYGARVEGTVAMTAPVRALLPEEMEGAYDVLFLMTKQRDNARTVAFLAPFLGDAGVLCTLQNGLPEQGLAEVLGPERVQGCVVEWGAELVSPGVSRLTSAPDSLSFGLGNLAGRSDAMLEETARLLSAMCPVRVEDNFLGVRWSKLLINAAFSGVSTVLGGTFGEAAKDPRSRRYVQAAIKECIDVARAEGVGIAPVQGKDIVRLLDYSGPVKRWVSSQIIPIAIKKHANIRASMLQDIEKGKLTEVDAINGAVAEHGRKHGVPTPVNSRIARIIHEMEKGQYEPSFDNVQRLEQ